MGSAPVVEGYRGGCNPGDVSHSFIRVAISVCLALRISSSRSILGGSVSACSLRRFASLLVAPLWHIKWVVHCKAPFAGPEQVLRYLSRYTHRVAISNRRLVAADDDAMHFAGRTIASTAPAAGRRCGFTRTSSSGASCCMCCLRVSTASATTGSLPPPTAPRASRRHAHSSMLPRLLPIRKSSRMLRRIPRVCCLAHAPAVALA
jgi:hypothetical protein